MCGRSDYIKKVGDNKNMNKMEFRFKPVELDFVDEDMIVSGYVNLTEQFSNVMRTGHSNYKFIERISKGAFSKAIQRSSQIDFLAEHDEKKILSSTRNNSLKLEEDDQGLFMSAIISPTSWGKDYFTLIKDGILKNFSFGMRVLDDIWDENDEGILERTILDLELYEVSVVRNPAYPQSNIQARHLDIVSDDDMEIKIREVRELRKQEDIEIREEETKEDTESNNEEEIQALIKTIDALDIRIEKMHKMLQEYLNDTVRGDKLKEEVEVEETVEEDRSVGEIVEFETRDTDEDGVDENEDSVEEEIESENTEDETPKEDTEEKNEEEVSDSNTEETEEAKSVSDKVEENRELLENTYSELRNTIKSLREGK